MFGDGQISSPNDSVLHSYHQPCAAWTFPVYQNGPYVAIYHFSFVSESNWKQENFGTQVSHLYLGRVMRPLPNKQTNKPDISTSLRKRLWFLRIIAAVQFICCCSLKYVYIYSKFTGFMCPQRFYHFQGKWETLWQLLSDSTQFQKLHLSD